MSILSICTCLGTDRMAGDTDEPNANNWARFDRSTTQAAELVLMQWRLEYQEIQIKNH